MCERAENLGRSRTRGTFDLVTARSFAPPAATAECAAPMLKQGGALVVSEPPDALGAGRWPDGALAALGLIRTSTKTVVTPAGPVTLSQLLATTPCPPRYPRRVGVPFKRPLF